LSFAFASLLRATSASFLFAASFFYSSFYDSVSLVFLGGDADFSFFNFIGADFFSFTGFSFFSMLFVFLTGIFFLVALVFFLICEVAVEALSKVS
jgi:hypothetical protein